MHTGKQDKSLASILAQAETKHRSIASMFLEKESSDEFHVY
jgi:hypothetical protein